MFSRSIERRTRGRQLVETEDDGLSHPPSVGHLSSTSHHHSSEDPLVELYQSLDQAHEVPRRRVNKSDHIREPLSSDDKNHKQQMFPGSLTVGSRRGKVSTHTHLRIPLHWEFPSYEDYRCIQPNGNRADLKDTSVIESDTRHGTPPPSGSPSEER
jgi:hypothetical protein